MSTSLPGWIIGHPTSKKVAYLTQVIALDCLARDQGLNKLPNCDRMQRTRKGKGCKIARRLKWSEGPRIKHPHWTRRSRTDQGDSYRAPYIYTHCRVKVSTRQPQSQPRLSLASTRVHLEECNPTHRRVQKVSEAYNTKSGYPLR